MFPSLMGDDRVRGGSDAKASNVPVLSFDRCTCRVPMAPSEPVAPLVEHFFRHEAGRLVSVLTGFFGWQNFDLVEEMVQATLLDALQSWVGGIFRNNPTGWIHWVAKNKVLDGLRAQTTATRPPQAGARSGPITQKGIDDLFLDSQIEDSQLRMIFACCHPHLARENQLALTLKALGGFGISEIARALLVAEEIGQETPNAPHEIWQTIKWSLTATGRRVGVSAPGRAPGALFDLQRGIQTQRAASPPFAWICVKKLPGSVICFVRIRDVVRLRRMRSWR